MSEPVNRIDHVLIHVGDQLDQAAAAYRRLGFLLTPRGHHSIGSSNHLAVFGSDYLELLGFEPQNAHLDQGHWGTDHGLAGLVFKTQNADTLAHSLHARDIATLTEAPQPLSRPVDLPDGTEGEARFRTLHLDPALTPEGRIFFCEHQTPELVWTAGWQDQPNDVTGITGVVVTADDPAAAIGTVQRLYPQIRAIEIDGGLRLPLEGAALDYLTPAAAQGRYGDALPPLRQGQPQRVALILHARSAETVEEILRASGTDFIHAKDGTLIVPASAAFGLALVFTFGRAD